MVVAHSFNKSLVSRKMMQSNWPIILHPLPEDYNPQLRCFFNSHVMNIGQEVALCLILC